MNDISEILSSVVSNPDLLDKISSAVKGDGKDMSETLGEVISLISESQGENDASTTKDENKDTKEEENKEASFDKLGLDGLLGIKGTGIEKLIFSFGKGISSSCALLIALKPFLKKSRQDFIEAIIKLSKLGSIAGLVK
jgi:hypothetical protein